MPAVRNTRASSSASESAPVPLSSSRSRGRSWEGQSMIRRSMVCGRVTEGGGLLSAGLTRESSENWAGQGARCRFSSTNFRRLPKNVLVRESFRGGKLHSYPRSEEHTSELQSHSFISYAVFC